MSSTPWGAARCRRAPAARRDPTPARMDGAAGRQALAQADGPGLRFGLGAADNTSVMDTPVLGIVLGVMGVTVGWWLLTAGPLGVRRQRRRRGSSDETSSSSTSTRGDEKPGPTTS